MKKITLDYYHYYHSITNDTHVLCWTRPPLFPEGEMIFYNMGEVVPAIVRETFVMPIMPKLVHD